MQRVSEHAVRRAEPTRARIAGLAALMAALLALALPAFASAATQTLTVNLVGTGTGTVTSSPIGIECGGTCSAPFTEGSTVMLKGVSGANTATVSWTGCAAETLEHECKVTMSSAKSVTATFNLQERPLKVVKSGAGTVTSSPAGIACGGTCTVSFVKGTVVTLGAIPDPGSEPVVWGGCESTAEGQCVVTMSAAKSVTATFAPVMRQLTVKKVGNGAGTVTSSPAGIACGPTCTASFVQGTLVTLTATPGLHTLPVHWSGCQLEPKANECQVTMSAAKEVSAVFMLERQWTEYEISVLPKGTGKGSVTSVPGGIECPGDCSDSYLYGTSLTLFATPAAGSEFDHWSVRSCGTSTVCTLSVRTLRRIVPVFTAVGKRTLTVAKQGSGQGTVSSKPAGIECGSTCSAEIDAPTKVVLKAKAASGSRFKGWSGEGCSGVKSCRVTMNEARNVTATFEKTSNLPSGSSETFVSSAARVRGGRAMLRVACNGPSPCRGTLKLLLKVRNAQGQAKGLVVGTAPFSLEAGTVQTLPVKLSQRAMRILAEAGRLKLRIVGATESHVLRLGQR